MGAVMKRSSGRRKSPDVIDVQTSGASERAIGGGMEGAARNSRELINWNPAIISPDMQIAQSKELADARGRDVIQNDGLAMGAIHTHRDSIVGAQFRLIAKPDWEALGATEKWADDFQLIVESRFNLLADSTECWFDASGTMTLTDMVRLAVGGFVPTGEVLATAEWLEEPGRPCKTAIQMVSPSRLSNPDGEADTLTLRSGIEINSYGRPMAYHIRSAFPGDYYSPMGLITWKRIPAMLPWRRRQVLHIVEKMQPGQTRGIADMVSTLKQQRMTKKFQDITLQNAVVNATYAAAIESDLPSDVVFGSMGAGGQGMTGMLSEYMAALTQYIGGTDNIAIDGVKMPHLFPGTKLNMKPAGTPGGVGTGFEESLLRHIAAPLGLSYEQFSKDYTKTNYSSARASMAETFKFMQTRKKVVADRFATMIYVLWLEEEINAKRVPLPKGMGAAIFYDPLMREALTACSWVGAARGQIDEVKETQAAIMRINAGLSTYEIEAARFGEDFRALYKQQAREKKMREEYGLDFNPQATKPGANDRQQAMDDGAKENKDDKSKDKGEEDE